ncbi:MAG: hypothetical protein GY775_16065 [Candidatus Scalindua sp.]|nr:hypothetical protein [Candidatus Scalindua sp.]
MQVDIAYETPLGRWTLPYLHEIQSTWHGLYNWSCHFFRDSFEQELADLKEERCFVKDKLSSKSKHGVALDPLSESGALQLYFMERNKQVLSEAEKLVASNPWLGDISSSRGYVDTLSELHLEPDGMPTSETKNHRLTQTSISDGNSTTSNLKVGSKEHYYTLLHRHHHPLTRVSSSCHYITLARSFIRLNHFSLLPTIRMVFAYGIT